MMIKCISAQFARHFSQVTLYRSCFYLQSQESSTSKLSERYLRSVHKCNGWICPYFAKSVSDRTTIVFAQHSLRSTYSFEDPGKSHILKNRNNPKKKSVGLGCNVTDIWTINIFNKCVIHASSNLGRVSLCNKMRGSKLTGIQNSLCWFSP